MPASGSADVTSMRYVRRDHLLASLSSTPRWWAVLVSKYFYMIRSDSCTVLVVPIIRHKYQRRGWGAFFEFDDARQRRKAWDLEVAPPQWRGRRRCCPHHPSAVAGGVGIHHLMWRHGHPHWAQVPVVSELEIALWHQRAILPEPDGLRNAHFATAVVATAMTSRGPSLVVVRHDGHSWILGSEVVSGEEREGDWWGTMSPLIRID